MTHVLLEAITERGAILIGRIEDGQLPGSISSDEPNSSRRLFVFGWRGEECGVWEADSGVDAATLTSREIYTLGFTKLSDLGEPYEVTIHRVGRGPRQLRFTRVTGPG